VRILAESIPHADPNMAKYYRQLAWQYLKRARGARWIGLDEPFVAVLLASALRYRRFSHACAVKACVPS
jgi:hypothetical protein